MSVVFHDSMQLLTPAQLYLKYEGVPANIASLSVDATGGPVGLPCLKTPLNTSASFYVSKVVAAQGEYIVHLKVKYTGIQTGVKQDLIHMDRAGGVQDYLYMTDAGILVAGRGYSGGYSEGSMYGVGTYLGTCSAALAPNTWNTVKYRVKVSATVGEVEVWVNNVQALNLTNVNTLNSGAPDALMDEVRVFWPAPWSGGNYSWMCDLVIVDRNGAVNNTFLPDHVLKNYVPAGAGLSTQFSPTTPTGVNWSNAANSPPNLAEYNSDNTVGHVDDYAMDLLSAGDTVLAVAVNTIASLSASGTRTIAPVVDSGAPTVGTSVPLTTSWRNYQQEYDQDPVVAGTWTVAHINGYKFGTKVTA